MKESIEKAAVLIIGPLPPPHTCGMRYVMVNLLSSQLTEWYRLFILDPNEGKPLNAPLHTKLLHAVKLAWQMALTIRKRQIQLVHIHTASYQSFFEKVALAFLCRLLDVPTILHIHGAEFDQFYNNSGPLKQWAIRRCLAVPVVVICLSQQWLQFLSLLTRPDKLFVVPNGVDTAALNSSVLSFSAEEEWQLDKNSLIVLFLGHIVQRKGVLELCEAATQLNIDVPWQLVLAGDGELAGQLRNKYVENGRLKGSIKMLGVVAGEKKRAILQRADIFVLPSYAEGLPVALLEAMAVGLPVVTTPVGAIPELVKEGCNGILVTPGDVNALTKAIEQLLANKSMRQRMQAQNRALIRAEYENKMVASKLSEVYEKLLTKYEARPGKL